MSLGSGPYFSRKSRVLIFRGWNVASRHWDTVTHWYSIYTATESSVPHWLYLAYFSLHIPPHKQVCSNYACCQWSCSKVCNRWSQFASFTPQGPCEICGILRGIGAGFCLSALVLLWQLHASHQFIIGNCYNEASSRLITEELDVIPLLQLTEDISEQNLCTDTLCQLFLKGIWRKERAVIVLRAGCERTLKSLSQHKLHPLASRKMYYNDSLILVCCVWFIKFCTTCLRL